MCPVGKAVRRWDQDRRADITSMGHFHQLFDGRHIEINGSLIGYNPYAMRKQFHMERPQQLMTLLDSRYGKTVSAPILTELV